MGSETYAGVRCWWIGRHRSGGGRGICHDMWFKDEVVASTGRIGGEVALCAKLYAERVPSDRVCTDCV